MGDSNRDTRAAWDTARKGYDDARARFDALPIGTPDEDAACDVWVNAMDHLIANVPAPDGEALAIKIELAATRDIQLPDEWLEAFAADARRLFTEGR